MRAVEDVVRRPGLHDLAVAHHLHAVAHRGDHAHVVGDQHDRGVQLACSRSRMSSRICACTVTSSAVVGSSAISRSGPHSSRHRDHHALAHAAGQFVRILPHAALRLGDAHQLQHRRSRGARASRAVIFLCVHQHLGDLRADAHVRRQRGQRVLEDHGDLASRGSRSAALGDAPSSSCAAIADAAGGACRCRRAGPWRPGRSGSCPSRFRRPRPGIRLRRCRSSTLFTAWTSPSGVAKRTSRLLTERTVRHRAQRSFGSRASRSRRR